MCQLRVKAGIVLAVCFAASSAAAQDFDCSNWDNLPQQGMNYCAHQEYETADKDLNALWPQVVAVAKTRDAESGDYIKDLGVATHLEALRAAQRAWIEFRDRQCELESYLFLGGTAQPMIGSSCKADMTRKRIAALQDFMESDR